MRQEKCHSYESKEMSFDFWEHQARCHISLHLSSLLRKIISLRTRPVRSDVNESCHTCGWVVSLIWRSHVTHMDESCLSCEWVMSHTHMWLSHITHMNELWTSRDNSKETFSEVKVSWVSWHSEKSKEISFDFWERELRSQRRKLTFSEVKRDFSNLLSQKKFSLRFSLTQNSKETFSEVKDSFDFWECQLTL